jgi:Flp pilus assembly protein TadD
MKDSHVLEEANRLADQGDHLGAIELYIQAKAGGDPRVGLNLGNSYVATGDHESAIVAFEQSWNGGCDDAGFNLAELHREQGRNERARIIYRRLIEKSYTKAMIAEAVELLEVGEPVPAEALLTLAAREGSETGDLAAGVLGHSRWSSLHDLQAEELLRRGKAAYPTARADFASLLLQTGRDAEGIAVLREGVALEETESMLPLANLLASMGDVGAAEVLYKRGYELGDAFAANNLAALRWASGRRKSARKWMRRAAEGGDVAAQVWLEESGLT